MNRFDWGNLHVGDPVAVHHPPFPVLPAKAGTVARVTVRPDHLNQIAVELDQTSDGVVLPAITTVHRAHPSHGECWRCDELASRSN